MIERRPTRRRSHPRDNRWRRTLPEANILNRKLLGLSTSSHWSFCICHWPSPCEPFDRQSMTDDQWKTTNNKWEMSVTAVSEENNQQSSSSSGLSALEILKRQDRESAKKAIAARLYRHGVKQEGPVDLSYVVKEDESVEALTPESGDDALEVYRHSTAHLLAAAVLDLYPGTRLGVGPALL